MSSQSTPEETRHVTVQESGQNEGLDYRSWCERDISGGCDHRRPSPAKHQRGFRYFVDFLAD